MHQFMRKPKSMTIRAYVSQVNKLNLYLSLFPPFANGQGMANDELLELLEFAVPNKWQKQFTLQGFKFSEQTQEVPRVHHWPSLVHWQREGKEKYELSSLT